MPIILGAIALIVLLVSATTLLAYTGITEIGATLRGPLGWGVAMGIVLLLTIIGITVKRRASRAGKSLTHDETDRG